MKKLKALMDLAKKEPQAKIYQKILFSYSVLLLAGLAALATCMIIFHYTINFSAPRLAIQFCVILNFITAAHVSINYSYKTMIIDQNK